MESRHLLTTNISLGDPGIINTKILGHDTGDALGYRASSAGDVNGDGYDDLIIGAFEADGPGESTFGSGEAYLIFGGPSMPATINAGSVGAAGVVFYGGDLDDAAGSAVAAAGDVNNDGFDDILITAVAADGPQNAVQLCGECYIIFGAANLPSTMNLGSLGAAGVIISGEDTVDNLGSAAASAGDFNGDGFDDVIIGAPNADGHNNAQPYAGQAYIIFGGASLPETISVGNMGTAGITIYGTGPSELMGKAVAGAGDVNGDGLDDVIIGAPLGRGLNNGEPNSGESYIIFGMASPPATIELTSLGTIVAGVTIYGGQTDDHSGVAVAGLGDINGDGYDDVIIGADDVDAIDDVNGGASYVIYGGSALPTTIDLWTLGSAGVSIFGEDPGDRSGHSVTGIGDIDGDGFDDLMIGAYLAEGNYIGSHREEGKTFIVYGSAALPSVIDLSNLGKLGFSFTGLDQDDHSGSWVASAGDVNGDGTPDLLISAVDANGVTNELFDAGEVYVVLSTKAPHHEFPVFTSPATFNVPENTTSVGTTVAFNSASPGANYIYTIVGGADQAQFNLTNPGQLSFVTAPDYEVPLDSDGDNVYHIRVYANDLNGGVAIQDLTITVTPVDDLSPVFTSPATFDVPEHTTTVGTVVATDGDLPPTNTTTYSITGGPDQAKFSITSNGALSFISAPTFNSPADVGANNVYDVQVTADDGHGHLTVQNIAVTVQDVNDFLPVFISPNTFSVPENTTAVGTTVATDADVPVQTVTYSITGGADQTRFSITSAGVLKFNVASDFENPTDVGGNNVYDVQVTADDGRGGLTVQSIAVTVTAVNDNAPVFTSSPNFSVPENTTAVGVLTATDADLPGQSLTYSIAGGVDQAKFSLTSGGVLTFISAPDFETPTDSGTNNVYNLQVAVSDGVGAPVTQNVVVTVTSVNDNSPVFTSPATFNVPENSTTVGTVTATDADQPAQLITFTITGGADQAKFSITNGVLKFDTAPDFDIPSDVGADNVYNVQVTANDGNGRVTVQNIAVTVSALNDNSPVFTSPTAFSIAENTTSIGTVAATDADVPGQTVTYSLSGGADQAKFSLSAGGVLTFITAPDFENPTDSGVDNVYNVQVTASDGNGGSTVQNIAVTVTPVNDNPLVFVSPTAFSVAENSINVGTAQATDADLPSSTVTYSISGGVDAARFSITAGGILTFVTAPDFEHPVDVGANNVYNVQVSASNGQGPAVAQDITVTVTAVNELPTITSSATFTIPENSTAVGTLTATDPDLPAQTLTFSISGGNDAARFSLSSGGVLSFLAAPDFDNPADAGANNVYNLQVTANDGNGGTATQNIAVTVTGLNDNGPVFTTPATFNVPENTTAVGTVNATDADLPAQTITYTLGGIDAAKFSLSNGVLSLLAAPDFENPTDAGANHVYDLQITANDGAGQTAIQNITVTVTAVNDNPPVFTSPTTYTQAENTLSVGTMTATDADLPAQTITYTLSGGVDQARFSITSGGNLSFITAPDFENPADVGANNVYNVQVRADDGQGSFATRNLTIIITNVDEVAPTVSMDPVTPDPRNTAVDSITISFSEPVTGFGLNDLMLTRNGGPNLLTGAETLSTVNNQTYTLSGLSGATGASGAYALTLVAAGSGITDIAGNALASGTAETWVVDSTSPTVSITAVTPDPRTTAVNSLIITFSEAITGLEVADLSLTRQGGANLLTGSESLTTLDNITYTLGNLNNLTGAQGTYTLALNANGSGIQDTAGNALVNNATESWTRSNPTVSLSVNQNTIGEANGSATVTATLSATTDANVIVTLSFSGSANSPGDYTRSATQITIPAGNLIGSITLTAVQDIDFDPDETIVVDITSVTNADENGAQQVTTTIVDDDHAPVFTSTGTPSIQENSTEVLTVVATDADAPGQPLTYSITGGADQAQFIITAGGQLSFVSAPNFEAPADSNGDNAYEVQVTANDGHGGLSTQNIIVTVTDVDETPTLNLGNAGSVTWIKRQPPVTVLPQVTVGGNASLSGGTLTISVNTIRTPKKSFDTFSFPSSNGIGATAGPQFNGGQLTLTIQLNQAATNAGIQSFLRGITFMTKGKGLKTTTRLMHVTLTDGHGLSGSATQTINVRKKA